ncbi:(2Fe-2S) ferredoxin domain-containing protein [Desertifilum sp. FACHB-1129]|uniref:Ferredoxin n=1 Tax=Desertifilum tharense IPPAS B-1220 TaxID=1781255 RepID=A0A1E5QHM1_9CYAN|nr:MULTISPECIES: (2Fe-2S) ferredoxin domain-containing protein [Desertifilum]MDA0212400.1 (2Fe-2S) ferredoxin domain-containing protein [Cyanobacteria bacterium FC1]MBD2311724.1 (2Fe-2S) ferredoxin domain-containing protein [Desertifilum sp. FACHB-1129]MBD2322751.1 (2Fe-2S) ferredoxin domain-containing protein [Desertifilum sp. FACHB-866]MBD2332855.1 (2Fe-2S) ferredoxin domain-containing protein [Desertifilum sp. FACHB-868]OEJ74175.1 ferredoxin [Desertifilum tharense IPPAS B-1220]
MEDLPRQVRICQNTSCRKLGSAKVLAAFQALPVEGVEILATRCLGQCGNGPMVLVLPDAIWYGGVHPDEVPAVVTKHLQGGTPVKGMLYST